MKQQCCICKQLFKPDSLIERATKLYCHMCDFAFTIEQMKSVKEGGLPKHYLSLDHYQNFDRLYSNTFYSLNNAQAQLAAYVIGIPEIYKIFPFQNFIFNKFPFKFQFNYCTFHIINQHKEIDYAYIKVLPDDIQNTDVLSLDVDFQLILLYANRLFDLNLHEIHPAAEFSKKQFVKKDLNSSSSKNIVDEMYRFYLQ